jgi:hypothetical protein
MARQTTKYAVGDKVKMTKGGFKLPVGATGVVREITRRPHWFTAKPEVIYVVYFPKQRLRRNLHATSMRPFGVVPKPKARKKPDATACRCREPKRDRYCCYCGSLYAGPYICGVCKEGGIDGQVIRGTSRVVCSHHKASK